MGSAELLRVGMGGADMGWGGPWEALNYRGWVSSHIAEGVARPFDKTTGNLHSSNPFLGAVVCEYSGPSLIRIAWDQSPFRLVKFLD